MMANSDLSPDKKGLLQKRLRERLQSARKSTTITPRTDSDPVPLSFAQERLWFLENLYPGQTTYNESSAYRLTGSLDKDALQAALGGIVRRHEIVRTTYHSHDGLPVQVVEPPQEVALPVVDLSQVAGEARVLAAQRQFANVIEQPFDLSHDLMMRFRLYRLHSEDHILLAVRQHIASDDWSSRIFWQELFELYTAELLSKPAQLAPLPIQYADYTLWQRKWLHGERLEHGLKYWRQQLAGLLPLELTADHKRPEQLAHQGAGQRFLLQASLVNELRELAEESGATFFMLLLTAFNILLKRYSSLEDIAVGTQTANRQQAEIEPLIGCFVNTLVLRNDLSGNPTVRELLHRVRQVLLEALEYQDIPFEKLVEELQPERHLNRNPLVSTIFQLIDLPQPQLNLTGLRQEPVAVPNLHAKVDLVCTLSSRSDGINGHWQYSTELFEAGTVQRMIGHFQTLLEGIVANPNQPINSLPLLTGAERQQMLINWNNTQTKYPADQCIHQLFEAQVERTPHAVALLFEGRQLTYIELNGRANQLAHYLRALGVGPEVLVAICVERSLEMIVGLLAILKAGGAYVPLDPAYPPARLTFMLQDTQPTVLLTQKNLLERLPEIADRRQSLSTIQNPLVFCLDSDWETIAQESRGSLDNWTMSHNLAYVMYTSGSTGKPKGVSVTHQGVASLVKETDFAELTAEEVFLQFAPLSFDASTFEIWGSLLNGARLVIFPPYTPSLAALGQLIVQSGITTLWLTAGLFHLMVDEQMEDLRNVRQLLAGGDVLSPPHVQKLSRAFEDCHVINGYGPTESTTFACCYPVKSDSSIFASIPIGRPISNTQIFVLDTQLQPVPVGVPGELYIGGAGLARGYFNRPELTAELFVANPFDSDPGTRLYKTGDLVRYLPDGNLEFLGRIDHQIKIRGFRIEPGEIEAFLSQHPDIQNSVVTARIDESGDKILVAYVIPSSGPLKLGPLRRFLKKRLPDHMVPSDFIMLETFPLTPNGKIDRRALPTPDRSRPELEDHYMQPQSPMERQLAAIWSEMLDVEPIGIHDNFFELGGHSLLGVRLFARIEEEFGKRLSMNLLYRAPTISQLVKQLQQPVSIQEWQTLVPIQSTGTRPPFFCVHGFGGDVLGYADLSHLLGADQPFYGLNATGLDDNEPADETIEAMAERYIEAMRSIQPAGPYHIGGYCIGGVIAFEIARQLQVQGESRTRVAIFEGSAPGQYHTRIPIYHPRRLLTLWRSVPYWAKDYWSLGRARLGRRARTKTKAGWRRLQQSLGLQGKLQVPDVLDVDLSGVPAHHQQLMLTQLQALSRYSPQPFDGSVTLFCAQWQTVSKVLFGAMDPQYGWDKLAREGVEIRLVAGSHRNILMKPQVSSLATQLADFLESADINL